MSRRGDVPHRDTSPSLRQAKAPNVDDDTVLTAVHEAGHAIACNVLVRRAYHPLSIVPDGHALGHARTGSFPFPDCHYPLSLAEAEVQVLLAGMAAEGVIGGNYGVFDSEMDGWFWVEESDHDISKAMRWLQAVEVVGDDALWRRMWILYRRTTRLMARDDVRAAVAMLVERLLDVRVIGENGVAPDKWETDLIVMEAAEKHVRRLANQRWARLQSRGAHPAPIYQAVAL